MLQIKSLRQRVAGRLLFDGATAAVHPGERVGLVGPNGCGKTTLLRLITGELQADEGEVERPRAWRVGKVAQDAPAGPESLIATVLSADKERAALLAEAEASDDALRLAEVHERLAAIRAEAAPARAARILAGLGFNEAAQQGACGDLSGGWRMRVALAALLFSEPDLLLLDEPSNHLDLEATLWLEGFLKTYPGTILMVSHDRGLLNGAVGRILHVEGLKIVAYKGNYDDFERIRRERQALEAAQRKRQEAERKHIQAFVDRFRYKASKARQAQSRLKALARMEPIASLVERHTVAFQFPEPKALAPPLITLDRASVGYQPDQPVLRGLDLRLDMDDRIALLGANGNGKSTLVKLLAGQLATQDGVMTRSSKLQVGYFAQDQAEALDLAATPLDHVARLMPRALPQQLRTHLGGFGFGQDKADVKVGQLSGGEKARLLFALMCHERPQLLLLDEPTNHLDVDARQALIQAINDYPGAVILVSHDRHLIELVADRLWLVADGTVSPYDDDLDAYRKLVLAQRQNERRAARAAGAAEQPTVSKKDKRRAAAEARAASAELRKKARQSEALVEKLGHQKAELERQLANPEVYGNGSDRLQELQRQHGQLAQALSDAEEAWLALQMDLDEA
ncbi:MAG: ABC-F family ATP-binding cassette domain-containing protein [Pseudomonadota bacterium]